MKERNVKNDGGIGWKRPIKKPSRRRRRRVSSSPSAVSFEYLSGIFSGRCGVRVCFFLSFFLSFLFLRRWSTAIAAMMSVRHFSSFFLTFLFFFFQCSINTNLRSMMSTGLGETVKPGKTR